MTLESRKASTLSLVLNWESLSASLTMTGRPVSSTLRTMLSLMAPGLLRDGLALDVARRPHARDRRGPLARRRGIGLAARARAGREGVVIQQDEALLGSGHVDDGVEHGLQKLIDVLHHHELLVELVKLTEPRQLLVGDVELGLADGRGRWPAARPGRHAARDLLRLVEHAEGHLDVPECQSVPVDKTGAALLLAVDEDLGLLVEFFQVEVSAVEEHLSVCFREAATGNGDIVAERARRNGRLPEASWRTNVRGCPWGGNHLRIGTSG